ncbi:aspartic proteinase 36-like [Diospyros lotus]|uniref:aspartic proteinase 36-like n=1 Tax=Diospyros lotus TaxID=55363 RepID=UPI00225B4F20|nr:aspartic proteinase 36-like [Diospyros lotus]
MDLGRRGSMAVAVGAVLLFGCLANLGSANFVLNVKHKFKESERSLAAFKAHDARRHGRSLASVDLPLGGNGSPTDTALYFAKIGIGSPPNDYYVQVDTGSDIMWVNCVGCDKCPTKSDLGVELKLYNPRASSTGTWVTCDQDFCVETFNPTTCKVGEYCLYGVTYGDGSSSMGYFAKDNVQLDRASGNLQTTPMNGSVSFGCGRKQSGQLGTSSQALDGILGFGQANSSMISQLASAGKVKKMFAHCLDGTNGGGIFAIGQLVQPKLKSTPIVPNQAHYNVVLKALKVGHEVVQLPTGFLGLDVGRSMVIDSGTTLAYLEDDLYNPLMKKILDAQPDLKLHTVEQQFTCFQFTGNVDDSFPAVTLSFDNSLSMTVYPREYLFRINDDVWCVGWQSGGMQSKDGKELNLLGDMVLSNKLVLYDLENQTIGWTEYNCSSSVKMRDQQTGAEYLVGPHDLSSAYTLIPGWTSMLLLLLAIWQS